MGRIRVAALDELAEGEGRCVEVAGRRIALFRIGAEVFALADTCSHAEASLAEGDVFDDVVECPLHGAAFDIRTGAVLSLPATKPVAAYTVEVENGEVHLLLPEEEAP
jgi:3-phenylpropionate/trans-cinnamate dioxygenase ferredoxin subunit